MPHIYDQIDIGWSWSGDLLWDKGDIADTSYDYLVSLKQDIHTICASALQDWEIYPGLGAGLDDFIGEPNTKETADSIHDRLRVALTSLGVVAEEDLTIKVIPVHINKVLIIVKVNAIPTPWNSLQEEQAVMTYLAFDFIEQGVLFFEKPPEL